MASANPYESPEQAGRTSGVGQLQGAARDEPSTKATHMTDYQLFGVVVRAIGVYSLWEGFASGSSAYFPAEGYSYANYALPGIVAIVLGAFMFFGADFIVTLTYRSRSATHA